MTALYEPSGVAAGAVLLVGLGPRARFDGGAAFAAGVAAADLSPLQIFETLHISSPVNHTFFEEGFTKYDG